MKEFRAVHVQTRKWPEAPHWEFDAVSLGADGHGHWLGVRRGAWLSRPGAGFHAHCDQVVLMPYDDWWCATFYGPDPDRPVDIYVDIATPATWEGDLVHVVDLDLDVIQGTAGRIWVDDEDEFAAHQVELGYPAEVIARARHSCDAIASLVEERSAPFDGSHLAWLARLTQA